MMQKLFFKIKRALWFALIKRPKQLEVLPPKSRKGNIWCKNEEVFVSKVECTKGVKDAISRSIDLMGGLEQFLKPGDRVLLKANFNTSGSYPASTSLDFLQSVIELVQERSAQPLLGESSGPPFETRKVLENAGIIELLKKLQVELIIYDENQWVEVDIQGEYLRKIILPKVAYHFDKVIYLPCMKTHRKARFSLSLKLAVGFTHPGERRLLHNNSLEEKIAEINLAWQPDLIIMDGRRVFVTGGPDHGRVETPGVILASGDMVAVDLEALRILMAYEADNRLDMIPHELPQIKVALARGLGKGNYTVVK